MTNKELFITIEKRPRDDVMRRHSLLDPFNPLRDRSAELNNPPAFDTTTEQVREA